MRPRPPQAGRTFTESCASCRGKAVLFNWCTPSLEIYPKSEAECAKIYDMAAVASQVVPEAALGSPAELQQGLERVLEGRKPLAPYNDMDVEKIRCVGPARAPRAAPRATPHAAARAAAPGPPHPRGTVPANRLGPIARPPAGSACCSTARSSAGRRCRGGTRVTAMGRTSWP